MRTLPKQAEPMTDERLQEIREAFNDTKPNERDPADVAIGELLAEIDRLEDQIGNWAEWV